MTEEVASFCDVLYFVCHCEEGVARRGNPFSFLRNRADERNQEKSAIGFGETVDLFCYQFTNGVHAIQNLLQILAFRFS